MPREKLNRNAYLFITYGRKRGHLHADQLAEAGTSTGERAAAETQNYAAQEVPKSRVLAGRRRPVLHRRTGRTRGLTSDR